MAMDPFAVRNPAVSAAAATVLSTAEVLNCAAQELLLPLAFHA